VTTLAQLPVETGIGSSRGLAGRVLRSAGALAMGAGVTMVGQVAVVPVALLVWGKERYGEWLLLTGLISVLRLTDLGLQTFVVNRMGQGYARGDLDEVKDALGAALRVQIPLALAILTVWAIGVWLLPTEQLVGLRTLSHAGFWAVAVLLATELLLGVPMGVVGGVYRITGHLPRSGLIGAVQQLAILGSSLGLIALNSSFVWLAVARVAIAFAATGWILYDLRRLFPWLEIRSTPGAWQAGLAMVGPGVFFLLVPLADYLSTQVGLLIVQHALEPGEVSRLATHRTALNVAQLVSGILLNAAWPELTALSARGRRQEVVRFHRSLARLNLWLVGSLSLGLLPLLPWIYPSWTAGRLELEPWTLTFLVLRLLLWAVWNASLTVLLATNRHQRVALALLGAAVLSSGLSVVLVPTLGIAGAALAALLGDLCVSAVVVVRLASHEIGEQLSEFVPMIVAAGLKGLGIPTALALIGWAVAPSPVVRLGVVFPLAVLVGAVFLWRELWPTERQLVMRLVDRAAARAQLPQSVRQRLAERE
jgi:O-antigen/teichoic acid export membrane protein